MKKIIIGIILSMTFDILYLVVVFVVILFSMTLHEAMHAFSSYWLGDDTAKIQGRLTLNPIKHIDPFLTILLPLFLALVGAPVFGGAKPVPFNPDNVKFEEWGVAIVALAGPLTNLLLAFLFYAVSVLAGQPVVFGHVWGELAGLILYMGVVVNLGFFIFNLIPIPPLDGSRVLYALAPEFVRRLMESIEQYSMMLIFIIIFFASAFIGTYIMNATEFFIGVFQYIL